MKKIATIAIIACLMSCHEKTQVKTGHEGELLPSFNLLLTDSTTHFNTQNIQPGQPFVLIFIGTHCPFSRAQIEDILIDAKSLQNFHFYIFAVESLLELKEFYNHYKLDHYSNFTIGLDHDHFFARHFNDLSVPYLAIYDENKRLKQVFIGKTPVSEIKNALGKTNL